MLIRTLNVTATSCLAAFSSDLFQARSSCFHPSGFAPHSLLPPPSPHSLPFPLTPIPSPPHSPASTLPPHSCPFSSPLLFLLLPLPRNPSLLVPLLPSPPCSLRFLLTPLFSPSLPPSLLTFTPFPPHPSLPCLLLSLLTSRPHQPRHPAPSSSLFLFTQSLLALLSPLFTFSLCRFSLCTSCHVLANVVGEGWR